MIVLLNFLRWGIMETWKPCDWLDGYKGVLEVSTRARVRRNGYVYETISRWGSPMAGSKPDKVLSCYVEKNGYATVAVQVHGRRKKFALHYLVARAFVPGYADGLCVNHIDGNKTNNAPSNLEWVTRSRNSAHAWETNLVDLRGDRHPSKKLTSGQVRIIRKMRKLGASRGEIAVLCRVSTSTIELIDKGLRWKSVT